MTTRYRVECEFRLDPRCDSHRRDQLIEWIKGLLAVPFVLHSQPTAVYQEHGENLVAIAADTHQRYAEIFRDVENLMRDHIHHKETGAPGKSKLNHLVPTVGSFFTPLPLEDAFKYQDSQRFISRRRFVAPSFNDIRLILNSAQLLGLFRTSGVDLVTFDGDVTLYDDGACLTDDNPVIPRLIRLLQQGRKIGIVTAAGYTEAPKYYERLKGLLDAVHSSDVLTPANRDGLVVMGGESNFLFRYDHTSPDKLTYVPREQWLLDEMHSWQDSDITQLLDIAESSLRACAKNLNLPVAVLRKDRAVGVYPLDRTKVTREQWEETVLVVQNTVERSVVGTRLPFCAFNGGNDVFVDIGDKSWGVRACQQYFGGIDRSRTLHIGDQFLSAGANDFKARLASTTAWIANPAETVQLLDELAIIEK
ncbi:IMP-specific 5'-nucleotidase [Aspergillus parasiticus SU-1]|uniref:IMP-specific 5'-nucleotidase 1 n=3 Tax=Aspergillus subgen. Circumdati TaxID=2720871 RepID=A0A5N6E258_ASPPA|nr:IMP-specific 5-nucleotidase [Aspergillus parasiticus]KAE8311864.1 IMP-specific 5-nucleotidase [Aspergillus transmontanensis]KJK65602.1 IMP-specific 5'-nucleotidase [Aspergillus parasiticus SU-1]